MRLLHRISHLFAVVAVCAGLAHAQSTATLTGTVKDPQGAVLPGATITIHANATGAERVTVSDSAGDYTVPSLQPGEYTITARATNFALFTVKNFVLQVDQQAALPITLALASAGETIEVSTGAPVIDSASITVGQVIDKATVQEIPLNGRHFLDLTVLTPGGVTAPATGSLTAPSRGVGAFSFNTAGNREDSVNFQINGVNLNDIANAQIVFQPSINTTSEMKLDNSTFSAEYGRNSGSIVNISTRSGTNQIHGEVFEYLRNNSFDARNFFNPKGQAQTSLKRHNFGASVGGPIWHDKTFFFASYEGLRQHQGLPINTSTLTSAQEAGVTDPVSKQLLQFIPAQPAGTNFISSVNGPVNIDQGTIDIMQILGTKDTIHGFYAYQKDIRTEALTSTTLPGFGDHRPGTRQILTLNETHVFTPRLVNEARLGFNRVAVSFLSNYDVNPTTLGFNNYPVGVAPGGGIPGITISGTGVQFGGPGSYPQGRFDTLGIFSDAATYTVGKHSIKFGGEFRRFLSASFSSDPGTLTFGNSATVKDASGNILQTAQTGIQNFQQGRATSFSITPNANTSRIFGNAVGAFVMDTYKVTPQLALELGFRFEWLGSPTFGGNKATIFDPVALTLNSYRTNGYNLPYGQNYNYMPRAGFTYDLFGNDKAVVRGGYAILSDQPLSSLVTGMSSNPPYTNRVSYAETPTSGTCTFNASSCNLTVPIESLYASTTVGGTVAPSAVQPNYKNATTQTFTLNLQYALPGQTAISVGYYGSLGRHLRQGSNINQVGTAGRAFTKIAANSPIDPNAPVTGNVTEATSNGNSNYNGLWVQGKKNTSHGLEFSLTWQFTKSMDNGSLAGAGFVDSTQPRLNYGLSDFDVRHRIAGNAIYGLPFRGNRWVEGFKLASILQWQTGNPLNITNAIDSFNGNTQRVSLVAPIQYKKVYGNNQVFWFAIPGSVPGAINPSASVCTTPSAAGCTFYTQSTGFSNTSRNFAHGPAFSDFDLSAYKTTKITERVAFLLRLDVFDFFNHASFSNPGTTAQTASTSFGVITATRFPIGDLGSSRQLQLSGKITF